MPALSAVANFQVKLGLKLFTSQHQELSKHLTSATFQESSYITGPTKFPHPADKQLEEVGEMVKQPKQIDEVL